LFFDVAGGAERSGSPMDKTDKPLESKPSRQVRNSQLFDFIVLIGMVLNMLLAVFLVLYYFDLL
jgi:hypothetical protein